MFFLFYKAKIYFTCIVAEGLAQSQKTTRGGSKLSTVEQTFKIHLFQVYGSAIEESEYKQVKEHLFDM